MSDEAFMHPEFESFHEALMRPSAERATFLKQRHPDEPDLVRRLLRLLEAHERAEREEGERPTTALSDEVSSQLGPYTIGERLGEGGMGVVYAAQQSEPLRRRVAVKVLKAGLYSRDVLARFEAERQALAILDHPGIAKVHDAGITELGRPFFVMELVDGLPITEHCSRHDLGLRDRLHLFLEVCHAVQHAHHRGIIHRDLKPSNLLVTTLGGRAIPKVIDFGVAKATEWRLTEQTVLTEQGRLIGTPEYMSPEQAGMTGGDIDTRTDVYALGVLLYELLTGHLPFDSKTLRQGGYAEILQTIRDIDPERPSARVKRLTESGEPGPPGIQPRSLRGELDWIVMRAIEKDRSRRYRSADALRDDVQRYLSDQPVDAGPPSTLYKVRKYVDRHRLVVVALGLALISAVLGVTGLAVGLVRAWEAEVLAERRADNAQATALFLEGTLFQADPEEGGEGEATLLDLMASATDRIPDELGGFPEVEASVRESLGVAYRRRSMFREAAPHLERSLELRRTHLGDSHLDTARAYIALADQRFEYQGAIEAPLAFLQRALRIVQDLGPEGAFREPWIQLDLGLIYVAGDRLDAAEQAFLECQRLLVAVRGPDHPDLGRPLRGLAAVALGRGEVEQAVRLAEEAVGVCGDEQYIAARARMVLAEACIAAGSFERASGILDETADAYFDTVGRRHIRIGERFELLGHFHLRQQQWPEVEEIARQCESLRTELLDSGHWAIAEARLLRVRAEIGRGEIGSAERDLAEIQAAFTRSLPEDHPAAIRVAEAQVESAVAAGDRSLQRAREEQLQQLRARRAARLALD